ncbi:MAG: TRAF-like protein [Monoraphidium minutum]|nr:MAG: TRAF-like protein [Monoraphidium minutum]
MRAALGGLNASSLVELQLLSLGAHPDGRKVKQTVTIEGFAGLLVAGGSHFSAPFFADGIEWRLKFYPGCNDAAAGTYLSLFLECMSRERFPITASCSFAVLREGGARGFEFSFDDRAFTAANINWGAPKYAALAQLRDVRRGYLAGDALRIEVAITVDEAGGGGDDA